MKKTTIQEIKRKLIQVAAFGYSNFHVGNIINGKLYDGKCVAACPEEAVKLSFGIKEAERHSADTPHT